MMRLREPVGHAARAGVVTMLYIVWSLVPVLLAIRFAFNSGRSRTSLQGWSFRWFWGPEPQRLPRPDARQRASTA